MTAPNLASLPEQASFDPKWVAPMVAWLAHEDVPVTGEIYTAGVGRAARFFVGMTKGYYNAGMTLEDVRDHFDQIRDETGYLVPSDLSVELDEIIKAIKNG
jgi:hypothetical protein